MEKYTYIRKTITWDSRRYEVRGKTEQEACEKLADLVVSLKRGEFAASGQTTVEQWFQQWMQTYKIPSGITPKSLRLYDEKYNGYIGPAIGQKKLQDVRDLHLQTILNTQAGRSYSHVSKLRMVLQELFRQARASSSSTLPRGFSCPKAPSAATGPSPPPSAATSWPSPRSTGRACGS